MPTPSTDSSKKRSRGGPIAALVVGVVLVLYPLSAGPAWRLSNDGRIPESLLRFYEPVIWLARRLPDPLYSLWWSYFDFWVPPALAP